MEIKPITIEDALSLYDEDPSGEVIIRPVDDTEIVSED